jgi:hypothetical protein
VGKLTATDDLGADWLVASATGSPGDDIDLIDFTNGLQGQRDKSRIYRREGIGTFILDDPVSVASENTSAGVFAYDGTWTEIDVSSAVPSNASSVIIKAYYRLLESGASLWAEAYARRHGSTESISANNIVCFDHDRLSSSDTIIIEDVSEFSIKIDGSLSFDFYFRADTNYAGSASSAALELSVVGYSINPV